MAYFLFLEGLTYQEKTDKRRERQPFLSENDLISILPYRSGRRIDLGGLPPIRYVINQRLKRSYVSPFHYETYEIRFIIGDSNDRVFIIVLFR